MTTSVTTLAIGRRVGRAAANLRITCVANTITVSVCLGDVFDCRAVVAEIANAIKVAVPLIQV